MLAFEQKETLSSLPFLIWEFSSGGVQEVMVVGDSRGPLVQ
jgi:hypothetical protein